MEYFSANNANYYKRFLTRGNSLKYELLISGFKDLFAVEATWVTPSFMTVL
jgi:hypothetical protein